MSVVLAGVNFLGGFVSYKIAIVINIGITRIHVYFSGRGQIRYFFCIFLADRVGNSGVRFVIISVKLIVEGFVKNVRVEIVVLGVLHDLFVDVI
jgi:hypothetical protein